MTECGLIKRYGYYIRSDIETIRSILQYEKLRDKRPQKLLVNEIPEPPRCKSCGQTLPPQPEGKVGRPKEYCDGCEPARNKERYRKWRSRRQLTPIENG